MADNAFPFVYKHSFWGIIWGHSLTITRYAARFLECGSYCTQDIQPASLWLEVKIKIVHFEDEEIPHPPCSVLCLESESRGARKTPGARGSTWDRNCTTVAAVVVETTGCKQLPQHIDTKSLKHELLPMMLSC